MLVENRVTHQPKCLLEGRIILWEALSELAYLQSVQIGHCVHYYSNMPQDVQSVCLMKQVVRFSSELWAPEGQGLGGIPLLSHTMPT